MLNLVIRIISRDHGLPKRISLRFAGADLKIILLPLFHPAAALYNGSMRQTLIDDFAQIPDIIRLAAEDTNNQIKHLNRERITKS